LQRAAAVEEIAMEQDPGDVEWLSVGGDLTRANAPSCLLTPNEPKDKLAIIAGGVERVDVVTGTAMRMRIDRHFRDRPDGIVTIMLPTRAEPAEHLLELLTPLPDNVSVSRAAELQLADPPRYGLLPGTVITDDEAAVAAGGFALEVCDRARISELRSNLAAWAVMELAANALHHAVGAEEPPVVALTVSGRERILEIAVTDSGRTFSDREHGRERLAALPGLDGGITPLAEFLRRGAVRGIDGSLEIMAGVARLRWTRYQHRTVADKRWIPGTTVIARIPA
jgi:anti-sigma regulatory factor (Ser/Thr protein kinase)